MSNDKRDVIETLRAELDFIEKGGYGRSVKRPWQPTSAFQDSLTCINYGDPDRAHPCENCMLHDLVPPERRSEVVPCHHIPLNADGETIETLELKENQQKMEETIKNWLRAKIREIKEESAGLVVG